MLIIWTCFKSVKSRGVHDLSNIITPSDLTNTELKFRRALTSSTGPCEGCCGG